MASDRLPFERGAQLYPQPVAIACGRLSRTRGPQEELDAALRAAEVLTRYLAVLTLCSVSARSAESADLRALSGFEGNLSFGKFLTVLQWAASLTCNHPLKQLLDQVVRSASWDQPLVALLELRNELGHDLLSISEARAVTVLKRRRPLEEFANALGTFAQFLEQPLFVFEAQELERRQLKARRLLLMGESLNPIPEEIEIEGALEQNRTPYIGVDGGCLALNPLLTWDVAHAVQSYVLYFIDRIGEEKSVSQALVGEETTWQNGQFPELADLLRGGRTRQLELCKGRGTQSFLSDWRARRRAIERHLAESSTQISWEDFDAATLAWFARRLLSGDVGDADPPAGIVARLLDGRHVVQPREMRELRLLFGSRKTLEEALRRTMLDCRARRTGAGRWDERVEARDNVLQSLRLAIEFFTKHAGVAGVSIDGLTEASGSADYIAMREALVNMFIHQDYDDQRTPAQIELSGERAVFFNAGKSLVAEKALAEGGRSQARNPLIARALRLIGFAELAGSGLRELHRAWNAAGRMAPTIESNSAANTFTLTLDWRSLPQEHDEFWQRRLGVRISPTEARVLDLCAADEMTASRIAAALGLPLDDVAAMLQRLEINALLRRRNDSYALVEHLREHLKQRHR